MAPCFVPNCNILNAETWTTEQVDCQWSLKLHIWLLPQRQKKQLQMTA